MARPIIDFEVERRHMSHAEIYNNIKSIPMYQQDVEQQMQVIKLTKAHKKKEPMTFLQCLLLTNMITPDDREAPCEFITSIKRYGLDAEELAEIKSILVCTISVSEEISKGITDAFTDFASGNKKKKSDEKSLYYTLYCEVYDRLIELCGDLGVLDAASIMGGD